MDLAFLDIDGTLVFPERDFIGAGKAYRCVDRTVDRQVGFASVRLIELLGELETQGIQVVPTTARSAAQLNRMQLFANANAIAILGAGATVIVDGVIDASWHQLRSERTQSSAPVSDVAREIERTLDGSARIDLREGALLVLKYSTPDLGERQLETIRDALGPLGWHACSDGRRLYLLPDGLSKLAAAEFVAESRGVGWWAAAGDSSLDVGLLERANYGVTPAGSWVACDPDRASRIHVTALGRPHAAEQVCETILRARAAAVTG
jgi:hydroxymethylpyrimidine pyrophosphatase-like HAD family hydrolase